MNNKNFWFFTFLFLMIILHFDNVKIHLGLTLRIAQLVIILLFGVILTYDIVKRTINISLLLFLFSGGILLTLISLNSAYPKIDEYKFIIKYLTTFPASFYLGYRIIQFLNVKELVKSIDITILVHSLLALLLYFYPISFLLHDRGPLTGYQGTFWEATGFGATIGLLLLLSIALRYEFKIFPKNPVLYTIFYIFALGSVIASKSKAFWIALIPIVIYFIFFKPIFYFMKYKQIGSGKFILFSNKNLPTIFRIKTGIVFILSIILIVIFFSINSLLEHPIVTKEMVEEKLQHERGKALIIAIDLLQKSNWLGGYGWGYVESYFTTYNINVIGLGQGIGMIFNSYLNEWISVGIIGIIFHFVLLALAFSNKYLFTTIIPIYLFIDANVHPIIIGETYYLFLGLSYGFKKYMENKVENV